MQTEPSTIYYTTNDGNIVNVHDYWEQPILNYYDKESDLGTMVFKKTLTEIPAISGHPFFYSQTNLLTLQLPKSIKKLNHGCFYDCSNLYKVNVEDLKLEYLGYGCFERTNIKKLDFSNSIFTDLMSGSLFINNKNNIVDTIIVPKTVNTIHFKCFYDTNVTFERSTKIKNFITPIFSESLIYGEDAVLENLVITKTDGLTELHWMNTDCIFFVPDEWYDGYVEKYTNYKGGYFTTEQCQDILNRLRKYSDSVPMFPQN